MGIQVNRSFWTPVVLNATSATSSIAYSIQNGVWAQSDSLITMGCDLQFIMTYTSVSGSLSIQGWPAGAAVADQNIWSGMLRSITPFTWPSGATQLVPVMFTGFGGNTNVTINWMGSGSAGGGVPLSSFPSGSTVRVQCSVTFVAPIVAPP